MSEQEAASRLFLAWIETLVALAAEADAEAEVAA